MPSSPRPERGARLRERLLGAAVSVLAAGCALAAAEAACWALNRSPWREAGARLRLARSRGPQPPATALGSFARLPAADPVAQPPAWAEDSLFDKPPFRGVGRRAWMRWKSDGRTVYDVTYGDDGRGRRRVPGQGGRRPAHALFLGCSFAFGEGVADDQTTPYFFAQAAPGYRVYDYGWPGSGPHDILVRLRGADLRAEVPEPRGIAVYVFIDAHVERLLGSMSYSRGWGGSHPYLVEDHVGRIVQRGTFRTGRPLRTRLYGWLGRSEFVRFFRLELPPAWSDGDFRFCAKVIGAIAAEYARQKGGGELYVAAYPGQRLARRLFPHLRRLGLRCVDYSDVDLSRYAAGPAAFPDGHPTPLAHRLFGRQLAEDIAASRGLR